MPESQPDRVADESLLFCALSTGQLVRLGAVMSLTKTEIIYEHGRKVVWSFHEPEPNPLFHWRT